MQPWQQFVKRLWSNYFNDYVLIKGYKFMISRSAINNSYISYLSFIFIASCTVDQQIVRHSSPYLTYIWNCRTAHVEQQLVTLITCRFHFWFKAEQNSCFTDSVRANSEQNQVFSKKKPWLRNYACVGLYFLRIAINLKFKAHNRLNSRQDKDI